MPETFGASAEAAQQEQAITEACKEAGFEIGQVVSIPPEKAKTHNTEPTGWTIAYFQRDSKGIKIMVGKTTDDEAGELLTLDELKAANHE